MDYPMASEALIGVATLLSGAALGLRFRAYVLIPAGVLVLATSAVGFLWSDIGIKWGVLGTIALLVVLNVGFAFGLALRAGAALMRKRVIAPLFARAGVGRAAHAQGRIGREAGADKVEPRWTS
jgi:hypothetical protein